MQKYDYAHAPTTGSVRYSFMECIMDILTILDDSEQNFITNTTIKPLGKSLLVVCPPISALGASALSMKFNLQLTLEED